LKELGFLVEIHPRTSRSVIRNGKPVYLNGKPNGAGSEKTEGNELDDVL